MAKEEALKLEGSVIEVLPNAMFRVSIDGYENPIIGVVSGKIRQNNIKITLGDQVEIEMSPYDITRGRITRRR